jgi:hypothetical protein
LVWMADSLIKKKIDVSYLLTGNCFKIFYSDYSNTEKMSEIKEEIKSSLY